MPTDENDVPRGFVDGDPLLDEILADTTENDAPRRGRPQGGIKSEAGRAAYWRMQWESAIGALADLIAEHTETVEELERVRAETWDQCSDAHHDAAAQQGLAFAHPPNPYRVIPPGEGKPDA